MRDTINEIRGYAKITAEDSKEFADEVRTTDRELATLLGTLSSAASAVEVHIIKRVEQ